jgi:hypothetical protein
VIARKRRLFVKGSCEGVRNDSEYCQLVGLNGLRSVGKTRRWGKRGEMRISGINCRLELRQSRQAAGTECSDLLECGPESRKGEILDNGTGIPSRTSFSLITWLRSTLPVAVVRAGRSASMIVEGISVEWLRAS